WLSILLCVMIIIAVLTGINELLVLLASGSLWLFYKNRNQKGIANILPVGLSIPLKISTINQQLFWSFLKIGSILYDSGYVLFAFLNTELVDKGLLSQQQLMDAIAVGQFTPGPVSSSVSSIGYQTNAISGLIITSLAIFLTSSLFVGLIQPALKGVEKNNL